MAEQVTPPVEPQAPIVQAPVATPVVAPPAPEPAPPVEPTPVAEPKAKAVKNAAILVTLSAPSVAYYGLDSDQVELVERGEYESIIKAGGQEHVVGNEEIS